MVQPPAGATTKALPAPKRQLIAEVRVELVFEAVGGGTFVQLAIVGTEKGRRLIFARRGQEGGIQIQHLAPTVICFERQPARGALEQRDIQPMMAGGTLINPCPGEGHVGVGGRPGWGGRGGGPWR